MSDQDRLQRELEALEARIAVLEDARDHSAMDREQALSPDDRSRARDAFMAASEELRPLIEERDNLKAKIRNIS